MSKYFMGTSYKTHWEVPEETQYATYQPEVCPKTGRVHWQWMLVFQKRKRWTAVCQLLAPDHVEICRDPAKARMYCQKTDTRVPGTNYTEVGQWQPGNSTLLDSLRTKRLIELVEDHPWKVRQLKELKAMIASPRRHLTQGLLITGEPGTGKSKIASIIGDFVGDTYWAEPSLQWWDGYAGEPYVVIDEMRGAKPEFILRLLDRYPLMIPYKGGFTQFGAHMCLMTSNLTLEEMYPTLDKVTMRALERRIKTLTIY